MCKNVSSIVEMITYFASLCPPTIPILAVDFPLQSNTVAI
jgi:hypothetical protein